MTAFQAREIGRCLFWSRQTLLELLMAGMVLTLAARTSFAQAPDSGQTPPATTTGSAKETAPTTPSTTTPSSAAQRQPRAPFFQRGPVQYLNRSAEWFASDDAKKIAANILTYQADLGGWPKNIDTTAKPYTGDREKLDPTFDNSATTDELRYLAHMYQATHDEQYRAAILKGIDYILKAQYPNGGWPQFYPPHNHTPYQRYITFNDDAMVRLMEFLREVYSNELFDFVDADRRQAAHTAFNKGIDCILKCQIKVDGKLTVWCAQHDEVDFSPRPARSYELVSLSGSESVGIVRLLMSLDHPSPEVVQAVDGAVSWFEQAKITGIRVERRPDAKSPKGTNKVVVEDPNAPPIWARFYEIGTNRPIFSDRDGVAKHDLSEIGYERRNGYNWLDYWPAALLKKEYPVWKTKLAQDSSSATK
ncbi:MAG TPA: pectate lyase [Pirellulales bacterium]|nr:pectate lyase [Pirellulales bacterium]